MGTHIVVLGVVIVEDTAVEEKTWVVEDAVVDVMVVVRASTTVTVANADISHAISVCLEIVPNGSKVKESNMRMNFQELTTKIFTAYLVKTNLRHKTSRR